MFESLKYSGTASPVCLPQIVDSRFNICNNLYIYNRDVLIFSVNDFVNNSYN